MQDSLSVFVTIKCVYMTQGMRRVVYLMIMTLAYPVWKIATLVMDSVFALHKRLIKWIEEK